MVGEQKSTCWDIFRDIGHYIIVWFKQVKTDVLKISLSYILWFLYFCV